MDDLDVCLVLWNIWPWHGVSVGATDDDKYADMCE